MRRQYAVERSLTAAPVTAYATLVRIALMGLLLLPLTAYGYGQAVLGTRLQVVNPGASAARKVTIKAKETSSDDTLIGDPTTGGVEMMVTLDGAMSSSQTFQLATGASMATGKPFWSGAAAHGFTYKDPQGQNGPVVTARIRLAKGTFLIAAKISGKAGAVSLVPPNPGSSACVTFHIVDGDIYHLSFASGRITNHTRFFRVSRPTAEGSCVGAVTTTSTSSTSTTLAPGCGNGVIDPGEMCDGEPFCTAGCVIDIYACCASTGPDGCAAECQSLVGMGCSIICGANPIQIGRHAVLTGPCPGGPFPPVEPVGMGTCAPPEPIDPTTVCCSPDGGGCTETSVTTTEELQSAVRNCGAGTFDSPVVGTCVAGTCVPAH